MTRAPFLLHTGARALTFGLALGALAALGACAGTNSAGPYAPASEESRNTIEAQRLTQQAAAVMDSDPKQAEALLRQALAADLYHGPAHNNLGVIYLEQGSLYPAASEFEWARKLMPGHPDPRMNLAFTLEQAGRVDEAIATYKTALEVYPDHLPTIQALARLQVRAARTDEHTKVLLHDIAFRGDSQEWRDWARREVVLKGY